MTMETLSKWKIKPYIDLYLWELFFKVEFPLTSHDDIYTLESFNWHSVVLIDDDKEYIISRKDFDEVMYCAMDAPPMVEYPKPRYHGKRIRVKDNVTDTSIRYYAGDIWNATWTEGMEGRGSNTLSGYSLMTDGNTGVCLSKTFVEKCFEVVE